MMKIGGDFVMTKQENKMGESISFYKAIDPHNPDRMKAWDVFSPYSTDCTEITYTEKGYFIWTDGEEVCLTAGNLKLTGKIIRAEPKVLSVSDWLDNNYDPEFFSCGHNNPAAALKDAFEDGHKNGRLERDLELRSFINAFEKFHTKWTAGQTKASELLKEIDLPELISQFRQLKPLNQDD